MENGLTEQRVVGEPADELAVVVVAGQHEASCASPASVSARRSRVPSPR